MKITFKMNFFEKGSKKDFKLYKELIKPDNSGFFIFKKVLNKKTDYFIIIIRMATTAKIVGKITHIGG